MGIAEITECKARLKVASADQLPGAGGGGGGGEGGGGGGGGLMGRGWRGGGHSALHEQRLQPASQSKQDDCNPLMVFSSLYARWLLASVGQRSQAHTSCKDLLLKCMGSTYISANQASQRK